MTIIYNDCGVNVTQHSVCVCVLSAVYMLFSRTDSRLVEGKSQLSSVLTYKPREQNKTAKKWCGIHGTEFQGSRLWRVSVTNMYSAGL